MTVYSVPRRLRSVHTVAGAQGAAVAEYGEDAQVTFSGEPGTIGVGVDGEPAGSCADGQPVPRGTAIRSGSATAPPHLRLRPLATQFRQVDCRERFESGVRYLVAAVKHERP